MSTHPFVQNVIALRGELKNSLLERDDEVDCIMLGLVAGHHVLFVGPPGTGKSALCNGVRDGVGCSEFARLLTKFTTPEEIFGPYDLNRLAPQNGAPSEYVRITTGYMPEAELVFLDEIWKASSAILNTMLQAMNERTMVNGNQTLKLPLRTVVAASNEWPLGEGQAELGAMFDRFLIRKSVRPITPANHSTLIWGSFPKVNRVASMADIDAAKALAKSLPIDATAQAAYQQIVADLRAAGIQPGDRRLRQSCDVARAAAVLDGSPVVTSAHLEPLQHVLWDDPTAYSKVKQVVLQTVNPGALAVTNLVAQAMEAADGYKPGDKPSAIEALNKLKAIGQQLNQYGHIAQQKEAMQTVAAMQTNLTKAAFGL